MKIMIIGSNGQLGTEILKVLKNNKSEVGPIDAIYTDADIIALSKNQLDIRDKKLVTDTINNLKPDLVINSAAYTNVDNCEKEFDLAFQVNALGAKNIAEACEDIKAKLVYVSTDYVFDGNTQKPYREYDIPCPINVYGKTKYLGEEYTKQFCEKVYIIRTSWLYGKNGRNFVKTIIKLTKDKKYLNIVNDQKGNPTNAEDLTHHILKIAATEEYGIYHCTGKGQCTWYDFACKIIEYGGIKCDINPITSEDFKSIAKRPQYSCLDNMMLRCTVGDSMRSWEEALKAFIEKTKN